MATTRSPPGGFPATQPKQAQPTAPSSTVVSPASKPSKKKKKNKKGKQQDDDDDEDLPALEDCDQALAPTSTAAHAHSSPSDLLSTASDLYRQIEAAAASALSTHPSFAASFPPPPPGTGLPGAAATDEAYWTSLPQHLRQFIRSALPLAAGLTAPPLTGPGAGGNINSALTGIGVGVTGLNGQQLPPLTHDQLSSAAAQLAQVVQSNWGQLGLGPIPTGVTGGIVGGGRGIPTAGSTTISLGSFPVTMPTREQMEHVIGSMGGLGAELSMGMNLGGGAEGEEVFEMTEDEDSKEGGEGAATKKKNKKKKKKSAAAAALAAANGPPPLEPNLPRAPPTIPVPTIPVRTSPLTNSRPPSRLPASVLAPKAAIVPPTPSNGKARAPPGAYPHPAPVAQPPAPPSQPPPSIAPKAGPSSERERIRDFWLGLVEGERRALVKVEKEAVLRKMKEQQRSGCSCAVCGRKRTAIEEELEVLYDAYYDELESYANHQVRYASSGYTIAPPPGPGPFPGSVDAATIPPVPSVPPKKLGGIVKTTRDHKNVRPAQKKKSHDHPHPPPNSHHSHPHSHDGPAHGEPGHTHSPSCPHHPHNHNGERASKGEKNKGVRNDCYDDEEDEEGDEEGEEGEEEYDEEEYDEEEEEEEYDDDEGEHQQEEAPKKGNAAKKSDPNDGDFFGFGKSLTVKGGILTVADDLLKNDGQKFLEMMEQLADKRIQREREAADSVENEDEDGSDEEEYDEDDEDDEDDDDDEGDEDDDEEEVMTEAERMEEGRRMFQIFAARMFEQRVLTAYREKVASERQKQLLRELEEEERLVEEKELKKAKENQKKKDKKKDQQKKKEEERLRKEADREAIESSQRQVEEARLEEERRKNEESRLKRESERKVKEEERQRKEEKLRLAKEEERLKKEEKLRVAKEARIALEKEQREKKAKDDADRKGREAAEKKDREEREEREKIERVEREAEAEKDRIVKARDAATALAAARAKQLAQTPKSPPVLRPTSSKPLNSIPGLPKAPAVKPVVAPSQQIPGSFGRPPLPPGVIPRHPQGLPLPQHQQQMQMSSLQQQQQQQQLQQQQQQQEQIQQQQQQQQLQQQQQQQQQGRPFGPAPHQQLGVGNGGGNGGGNGNGFAQQQRSTPIQGPPAINGTAPGSRMFSPPPIGSQQSYGSIGMQQGGGGGLAPSSFPGAPQQPHVSPVLNRSNAPIGPPPPRTNGVSPIAPPSSIASPTPRPMNIGPIGGIIGRPSSSISSHPASSQRSSSPPRIFGSSALFEDDEIIEPRTSSSTWSSAPFSTGIWGAPAPSSAPQSAPDRNSVIRDRARVSYLKLDELSMGTNKPIAINDVHRALITLWPDSVSVDLKELVESMLLEGTLVNGGGGFAFTQRGEGLYAQFNA